MGHVEESYIRLAAAKRDFNADPSDVNQVRFEVAADGVSVAINKTILNGEVKCYASHWPDHLKTKDD